MEYTDFTMSMYANETDLYKAKADYFERLTKYLDQKIESATKCHPRAVEVLLDEAKNRTHFGS